MSYGPKNVHSTPTNKDLMPKATKNGDGSISVTGTPSQHYSSFEEFEKDYKVPEELRSEFQR